MTRIITKPRNKRSITILRVMVSLTLILTCIIAISSCSTPDNKQVEAVSSAKWLGLEIDRNQFVEETSKFIMTDSTGAVVGEMILGFQLKDDVLYAIDTSLFYDSSTYETGNFEYDLESTSMKKVGLDMHTQGLDIALDIDINDKVLSGLFSVNRDGINLRNTKVDSLFSFDIIREEVFLFVNTVELAANDTLNFNMLYPINFMYLKSQLIGLGDEILNISGREIPTNKIYLKTEGGALDNFYWVSKEEPRRIVKILSPNFKLTITRLMD